MKGTPRRYTQKDENLILALHQELDGDALTYFSGASAIDLLHRFRYPSRRPYSLRFIGRTLAKYGLATKPKVRRKGVSRYLHYPKVLIDQLGPSLLEIDFIGHKFITGRTEPVNFIGFSLVKPRRLKYFERVESNRASEVITSCTAFFTRFERPSVVKFDNGFAFAAAGPEPRTLNAATLFFLKHKIIPVFTAPRKPWNQASIEGSNSVFSRKFWHRHSFRSLKEIDLKLKNFNASYEWFTRYRRPSRSSPMKKPFVPRVYFIRKIYENPDTKRGDLEILKEHIPIHRSYIGMFVLAEWNLKTERLKVLYELNEKPKTLKTLRFHINTAVKEKML